MTLDLNLIVKELQQEKGISQELIIDTVETAIKIAYEKYYGTIENLVIRNNDELVLSVFSKKEVKKKIDDDLFEISLKEAKEINGEAEDGDTLLIPCNPEDFGRIAVNAAKQIILQRLREIKKDKIYSEFKSKEGELIIGYIQRIRGDSIYVDIGNYEGMLPKRNQTPHESYQQGDRIKTIIEEVKKTSRGNVSVILSRRSTDFIKKLFEVEIPEIYDNTVQINKIAREPGYRTKIAVSTDKEEIDPVGACVGQKGIRVHNIMKELEDEKIDILRWTIDPKAFIADALIPAKVQNIVLTDEPNKRAVAILDQSQLSFAIGKKGLNIRLANALTDWNIDVKTPEQAIEMKLITDHVQAAEELFREDIGKNEIDELELPKNIKEVLKNNSINTIEEVVELSYDQIKELEGMNEEMAKILKLFLDENFEVVIEDETEEVVAEDKAEEIVKEDKTKEILEEDKTEEAITFYECPNCGGKIAENQTSCPSCGVEVAFEEDADEDNGTE